MREHIDWLQASAARFDKGHISESKRIAVAIRTLVHNTAVSSSLLRQLGVLDQMSWLSAARSGDPRFVTPLWTYDPHTPGFAHVDAAPANAVDFVTWWNGSVVQFGEMVIDRSWLVLHVANFDGGAHVDARLPAAYKSVSRDGALHPYRVNSVGALYPDSSNPIPWGLRTICNEVVYSIEAAL